MQPVWKARQRAYSLIKPLGSVHKFKIVMAPPEMSNHGAHSGAVIERPMPPASGTTTAESMNSSSMPSSVANIPIARNILFHMMVPEIEI